MPLVWRLVKTIAGVTLVAWALSASSRRRSPPPMVTRFDPTAGEHAPGGMGLSYSYYRED